MLDIFIGAIALFAVGFGGGWGVKGWKVAGRCHMANSYGGHARSMADRVMRKGLSEAATEIAVALSERVK